MRRQVISLKSAGPPRKGGGIAPGQAAGPSETLGQAYVRRYAEMREFLRRRVGDREVADELIQSAWVAISPRANDQSLDNPDAWLQRVVTNLALNWLKSSRYRARLFIGEDDFGRFEDGAPLQDELAEHRQSVRYLSQLLDELPPRQREVFLLYRGEGLSLQETADRLGISIKTVTTQLQRTMIFLRKRMGEADLWP